MVLQALQTRSDLAHANKRMIKLIGHRHNVFNPIPAPFDITTPEGQEEIGLMASIIRYNVNKDKIAILRGLVSNKQNNQRTKRPLFFLSGETHTIAAHRVSEMLLIQELQDSGITIACGQERPHNHLNWLLDSYATFKNTHDRINAHNILNNHPARLNNTQMFLATSWRYGNISDKIRTIFLQSRNISQSFNDAASLHTPKNTDMYLDQRDKITLLATKTAGYNPYIPIDSEKADGMDIRNKIMVDAAIDDAAQNPTQLYIQLCGTFHVAGQKNVYPFEQSLLSVFMKAGQAVLARPTISQGLGLTNINPKARKLSNCLTHNATMGRSFYLNKAIAKEQSSNDTVTNECSYMYQLMACLGMDIGLLNKFSQIEIAAIKAKTDLFDDVLRQNHPIPQMP